VIEGKDIDEHAYVHQIKTTSNFKTPKPFSWFIGGLNHQVEHHLFTMMSHVHYKNIAQDVRKVIERYGYTYNVNPSFIQACISHLRKLKELGMQPQR
jgi:linoleoyl-CoA desaturase